MFLRAALKAPRSAESVFLVEWCTVHNYICVRMYMYTSVGAETKTLL